MYRASTILGYIALILGLLCLVPGIDGYLIIPGIVISVVSLILSTSINNRKATIKAGIGLLASIIGLFIGIAFIKW